MYLLPSKNTTTYSSEIGRTMTLVRNSKMEDVRQHLHALVDMGR